MKLLCALAGALILGATPVLALETVRTTTVALVTQEGTVVEYVPGKTLVLRDPERKVVTYTLTPELTVGGDVAVGRTVTVHYEPVGERQVVRRVTTTSVNAAGERRTTTETTTALPQGGAITSTGTVVEYVPSKSIVVRDASDRVVTYSIGPEAVMPSNVQVGQSVTLYVDERGNTVRKMTTTSVGPGGTTTRSTETRTGSTVATTTIQELPRVQGVVSAYRSGETITIRRADGTTETFAVEPTAAVPMDLSVGRNVVVRLAPAGQPKSVRSIIYYTD